MAVAEKAENTGSIHYKDLQSKPEGATTAAFVPIIVKINYANLKPLKQRLGLCSPTRSDRVRKITPSWFHGVDEAHTHKRTLNPKPLNPKPLNEIANTHFVAGLCQPRLKTHRVKCLPKGSGSTGLRPKTGFLLRNLM